MRVFPYSVTFLQNFRQISPPPDILHFVLPVFLGLQAPPSGDFFVGK